MKKIFAIFLSALFCLTAVACKGNGGDSSSVDMPSTETNKVEETNDWLLALGKSDYQIVIPTTNNIIEQQAAEEFNLFFSEATGKTLPVITDENLVFSKTDKYISLGQNALFKTSGIKIDNDPLVGDRRIHFDAVRLCRAHDQNITNIQGVLITFNMECTLAGKETVNFCICVGMHFKLVRFRAWR